MTAPNLCKTCVHFSLSYIHPVATQVQVQCFEVILQDASVVRSPVGDIFDQCMGSMPIQHAEEFG
jgi:hypothetical protein